MPAGLDSLAGRLHPDELHLGVVDERNEQADRVRAAADAADDPLRQPAGALEDLGAGLVPDHALEVADECRVGRGPDA